MLGEKIKQLIKENGLTQREFGERIGKTDPCINQWIKGKRDVSTEDILNICHVFSVSPNYLYGQEDAKTLPVDICKIDMLDVHACCGNGIANFQEGIIGQQYISRNMLKKFTFTSPENVKIIEAVGDSMTPTINPYDMLWIDISVKEPSNDGMYLLMVGDQLMIKRIQINPFNNQIQIKSDNPNYAPILLDNYKEVGVLGKVVYHMKRVG